MAGEQKGKHILLVDEDRDHRTVVAAHLASLGHRVEEAPDGHQAWLAILRGRPEVVICGERLPGLCGTEVLALVRRDPVLCQTPFILMAAQHDRSKLTRPLEAGASEHLPRPFSMSDLEGKLRRALVPRPSANRSVMRGDLKFFSLPDVLIMTHQNRQTGLMQVEDSARGARYSFLFASGSLVWVSGSDKTLGLKSFNRSLRITEGAFGFTPWARLERQPWHEDFNVNNILLGGIQEVDEMPILMGALPKKPLRLADDADRAALASEPVVAPLLKGTVRAATPQELLDWCPEPDLDAGKSLKSLWDRRWLREA